MPRIRRSLLVASAVAAALMTSGARPAEASCGPNPVIGEICTFAFGFCPKGFLPADGALLPISDNTVLFSLIGTAYGGNGFSNFALPDLRGRTTVGTDDGFAVGTTGGGTTTVNARAATASGGIAVPAAQSPFVGLTRCIANTGSYPPRPGGGIATYLSVVGEVFTFTGFFCPSGSVSTDGGLQSISQSQAAFFLMGTTFGGDGQATFGVPNLIGAAAVGTGQGIGLPNIVLGQSNGNTSTVNVQTAAAKSVAIPAAQSPFVTVTSCVSLDGIFPQQQ